MTQLTNVKLYVIPGSHPCATVEAALMLKQIPYRRIDLLPAVHVAVTKLLFGTRTVPALRADGLKISGSRQIIRLLELAQPQPPLYPQDTALKRSVEKVERWGDEIFQPVGRTVIWPLFALNRAAMASYTEGAKLPVPIKVAMALAAPVIAFEKLLNRTGEQQARLALGQLPAQLERIDGWIGQGVIGAVQANAADLQIGSTLALLNSIEDLKPLLDAHPQLQQLIKHFPSHGRVPAGTIPAGWLPSR